MLYLVYQVQILGNNLIFLGDKGTIIAAYFMGQRGRSTMVGVRTIAWVTLFGGQPGRLVRESSWRLLWGTILGFHLGWSLRDSILGSHIGISSPVGHCGNYLGILPQDCLGMIYRAAFSSGLLRLPFWAAILSCLLRLATSGGQLNRCPDQTNKPAKIQAIFLDCFE